MEFIKKLSLGYKVILLATLLMIFSLFLPYVDFAMYRLNGFQQQGYIFLILFILPAMKVFKNERIHNIGVQIAVAILNSLLVVYFYNTKRIEDGINISGIGLYVALVASVMLVVGLLITYKEQKAE